MGELQAKQATELSDDINVLTAEIKVDLQGISEGIFRVGARLKKIRDKKLAEQKGGWSAYCENELGITRHHANRFIRVFERFGSGTPGYRLPHSLRILDELVGFTDEELAKPRQMPDGTVKKLTEMSRREIEEVKQALKEAEKRAEQAERYAEEKENEVERLKSRPKPEPRVEVRTEYVEVEDQKTRERLRKYEERFGDIEDYEREGATRITNAKDVTVTVMMFSSNVRDLVKRFSHLKTYKSELHFVDEITKREYQTSVNALQQLVNDLTVVEESTDTIIDIS